MKCFLLATTKSDEESDQAEYALVAIDADKAKDILAKKELFQMAKSRDADLNRLTFWDGRCYFYDSHAEEEVEKLLADDEALNEFFSEGKRVVGEEFSLPDEFETRTEADQLVVTEGGFFWCANSKYGGTQVETKEITYTEILGM